jgi:hypothetical protein
MGVLLKFHYDEDADCATWGRVANVLPLKSDRHGMTMGVGILAKISSTKAFSQSQKSSIRGQKERI